MSTESSDPERNSAGTIEGKSNTMFSLDVDAGAANDEDPGAKKGDMRGSSALLDTNDKPKYLFCCIPAHWIILPEDGAEVEIKNGYASTVFLLLNYMIGSGILVQGYVFREAGIAVCVILYIIIALLNYTGVDLIVRVAEEVKVFDYSELATTVLGKRGSQLVDWSIVVGGAGSLLSYFLIIGSVLEEVIGECSGWYCNVGFITVLCIGIFTVPLCLLRNFGHLAVASYFSISVISATIMLVIIGGPIEHPLNGRHYNAGAFLGTIRTIGDIVFALGFTTATFHAYNGLDKSDRNIQKFSPMTITSTLLGTTMCFCTGLAGYLSFGDDTQTNILENFGGPVGDTFKVFLVAHLILYIPGDFVILRAALLKLFEVDVLKQSNLSFLSVSIACIVVVTFVAVMLQLFLSHSNSLGIVVDITGGVAGSMLYFVTPALCAVCVLKEKDPFSYYRAWVLLAFGAVIIVSVIVATAL